MWLYYFQGFPGGSVVKNPTFNYILYFWSHISLWMMQVLDAELPMLNLVSTACSLAPDVRFLRGQPLRFFFFPWPAVEGQSRVDTPIWNPWGLLWAFFFSFFNWRVIALQCCVSFCYITTCISHMYRYIPSLLYVPPTPPSQHLGSSQIIKLSSLCYTTSSH